MLLEAFIYDWNTERNVVITEDIPKPRTLKKILNNFKSKSDSDSESDEEQVETFDIDDDDEDEEEQSTFRKEPMTIYCFGVDKLGNSIMIRINGIRPKFYILLPEHWTSKEASILIRTIKAKYYATQSDGILATKFIRKYRFDGFTNKTKFPFLEIEFDSMMSFYIYRKKFDNPITSKQMGLSEYKFKLYESDLDQLLRFYHKSNLSTCGWLEFDFSEYSITKQSKCDIEYEIDVSHLKIKDCVDQSLPPQIPICSFDIECTRGAGDGMFPQYDDPRDPCIQIGATINMYGNNEVYSKYISVLGTCDPIDGVIVEAFSDERDVILAAVRHMNRMKVAMLTGYNIYGFDLRYLYKRACLLGIESDFLFEFSKIRNAPAIYEEKKLVSSGLGDNTLYLLNIPGIVTFDVMKVLQGDPTKKLNSWKLDFVAETYMGQHKNDLKVNDLFRLQKGTSADRKIIAEYCVQDCVLVNNLCNKLCIVTDKIGMANVCSVPLSYIFLRGQGIKIFSLVAKFCSERDFLIPTKDRNMEKPTEKYQGAIVLNMHRGYYSNPIFVLDFNSLYPSSQITANLSHDTFVNDPKYDNLPGVTYRSVSYTEEGKVLTFKWAKREGEEGIIPMILKKLLSERKAAKKLMEKADEDGEYFLKSVYDGKQNALKVTCNSVYGQCGAFTSNIYLRELAACTTALGREFLTFSRDYVETMYGYKCVYGDSVANYTPIPVLIDNEFHYKTIEELGMYGEGWVSCIEEGKQSKEATKIISPLGNEILTWSDKGWTSIKSIIRHQLASHKKMIRVITNSGLVDVTDDHSLINKEGNEITPSEAKIGLELLHKELPNDINLSEIVINHNKYPVSHKEAAIIAFKHMKMGIPINIDRFCGVAPSSSSSSDADKIISMEQIEYNGYVYDLTTENHHFAAGIGNLIVHNTDSIFVLPIIPGIEKMNSEEKNHATIEIGKKMSKEITGAINSNQMVLAYEKIFSPFALFTKKRYLGVKYEENPKKGKLYSSGLATKRRDSANVVKKIYNGLIEMLFLREKPATEIEMIRYYIKQIKDVLGGSFPIEDFIITVTMKAQYKRNESIRHWVLNQRIAQRDPSSVVEPNDRMMYCYVENLNEKKSTVGSNIETVDFIKEKNLKLDYLHYVLNQIIRPTIDFMSLFSENPMGIIEGVLNEAKNKRNLEVRKQMNKNKGFREIHDLF